MMCRVLPIFRSSRNRSAPHGFTLIEASIVMVIIGVGVVAMLQFLAAGTIANAESAKLTTAINLARNIREMTQTMTFDAVLALDGHTYTLPVDARGQTLSEFTSWSQAVSVTKVDPNRITLAVPSSTSTPMVRVSVQITHNGAVLYQASWLVVKTA